MKNIFDLIVTFIFLVALFSFKVVNINGADRMNVKLTASLAVYVWGMLLQYSRYLRTGSRVGIFKVLFGNLHLALAAFIGMTIMYDSQENPFYMQQLYRMKSALFDPYSDEIVASLIIVLTIILVTFLTERVM